MASKRSPQIALSPSLSQLASDLGTLLEVKNEAYGDSFRTSARVLETYYPDGVRPEQYRDMLAVVRILDKLSRIATRKNALGESPWQDIAGYGLLALRNDKE